MRSGLLAVGVILLVLGAIFYFVPTPASDTETSSVTTETFNTFGNETNKTGTNTVSDTSERENTAFNTGFDDETEVVRFGDGDPVAFVYVDNNGDMYSESGQFLGEGLSNDDLRTRVADTYGTSGTTRTTSGQTQTVSDSGMQNDNWQTQTVSDTESDQTGVFGQTDGTDESQRQTVSDSETQTSTVTGEGFNDPDTFGDAEDNGLNTGVFAADRENTAESSAAGGFLGSNWLRTLAILSMVLGAILTILGLVLPDNRYDVDARARTAGPAGRRVRYEREEERHIRK